MSLTDAEWDVLDTYVRQVADTLALRDWTFRLERDQPCPDDAGAQINCLDGRRHALLRINRDFRDEEPGEQRHQIVHEVIHCHFAAAHHTVELDVKQALGEAAGSLLDRLFSRSVEYAVDGLAQAVAPTFPLIDWPKEVSEEPK